MRLAAAFGYRFRSCFESRVLDQSQHSVSHVTSSSRYDSSGQSRRAEKVKSIEYRVSSRESRVQSATDDPC